MATKDENSNQELKNTKGVNLRPNHKANKPLLFGTIASSVLAVALILTAVIVNLPKKDSAEEVSIEEYLDDTGPSKTQNSTRALRLTEKISEKLANDPEYAYDQAVAEYEKFYKETSGELKVYIAIQYATFIYNKTSDLDSALKIMDVKDEIGDNDKTELDYYNVLLSLAVMARDQQRAEEYQSIIHAKYPNVTTITINEDINV